MDEERWASCLLHLIDREFFESGINTLRRLSDAEVMLPGCMSDARQSKSAIKDLDSACLPAVHATMSRYILILSFCSP